MTQDTSPFVMVEREVIEPFVKMYCGMFVSGHCGGASPEDWPDKWILGICGGPDALSTNPHGGCLTVADFRRLAEALASAPAQGEPAARIVYENFRYDVVPLKALTDGELLYTHPVHPVSVREALIFWYKNYRGEEGYRRVIPISFRFGASEWHDKPQWLMLGFDTEKDAEREFAMADMKNFVGDATVSVAVDQKKSTAESGHQTEQDAQYTKSAGGAV